MIDKLDSQAVEEATKESQCKADIKEDKMQVKVKIQQMKALQARSDSAQASFTQLGTEIQDLSAEVKNQEARKVTWTKERAASRVDNEAMIKEASESVEALNSSIGVLKDLYAAATTTTGQSSGLSRLQLESQSQKKMPLQSSEKADAIIEFLLTAQSDFQKLRQSTEASERDQQKGHEAQQQLAEVSVARKRNRRKDQDTRCRSYR